MIKVGLTGNIASGKSTVEKIFREKWNIKVLDVDKIGHNLLENDKESILKIKELFSNIDIEDNDGKLSRDKIARIVFKDILFKKKLESILHPKIKKILEKFFEVHKKDEILIGSVPLLFEVNMEDLFDKIILIISDDDIRKNRLMLRNGYTEEQANLRIKAQMDQNLKMAKSDYIIVNNNNKEELYKNIKNIYNLLNKIK